MTVRLRRIFLNASGKPDTSFINPNLAIGGVCSVERLWRDGIRAILDLREEAEDSQEDLQKYSMIYIRIGLPDRGTPTFEDASNALNWIRSNLDKNKKVFIHCNLGRGRAPLLACIYLMSAGMNAETAIRSVKRVRKYTYFNSKQLQWIHEFQNQINRAS
ncbi:MAG: dual specificity protein phosphatase family protein [Nitrososphaerales archaeon]